MFFSTDGSTGVVAFFARLTTSFTGSDGQAIPFDTVELNVGDAYDPINGEFTAPVDGIYSISYEILADDACGTTGIEVGLKINGVLKATSHSEEYSSGGSSLAVQLTAGDVLWVAIGDGGFCNTPNNNANYLNFFSGYLIYNII